MYEELDHIFDRFKPDPAWEAQMAVIAERLNSPESLAEDIAGIEADIQSTKATIDYNLDEIPRLQAEIRSCESDLARYAINLEHAKAKLAARLAQP